MSVVSFLSNPSKFKRIFCKVAGVSFDNRQSYIAQMNKNTKISLERDPENEFDRLAVKVFAELDGSLVQIGFIPVPMNKVVCAALLANFKLAAKVEELSKRTPTDFYSVKISISCND